MKLRDLFGFCYELCIRFLVTMTCEAVLLRQICLTHFIRSVFDDYCSKVNILESQIDRVPLCVPQAIVESQVRSDVIDPSYCIFLYSIISISMKIYIFVHLKVPNGLLLLKTIHPASIPL